jgi:Recombination endonuclease VII.
VNEERAWHRLSEIDEGARTAECEVCGTGAKISRAGTKGDGTVRWMCATAQRERHRKRMVAAGRTLKPAPHKLSDVKVEERTALCSLHGGRVAIYKSGTKKDGTVAWACAPASQERQAAKRRARGVPVRVSHSLSDVDEADRTAFCSAHGERVEILSAGAGLWRCAVRQREAQQRWADRNPGKARADRYSRTVEQISELEVTGCVICGHVPGLGEPILHIDHDHSCCPGSKTCGKCVRGALCRDCNRGLGCFKDNPDLLMSGVAYLLSFTNVVDGLVTA